MEKGKIKWYDEVKGFGFIETENGKDIFVHRTGLAESTHDLQPDQAVEFEIKDGPKGLFAVSVVAAD
jgi:CspA family cold shock protein